MLRLFPVRFTILVMPKTKRIILIAAFLLIAALLCVFFSFRLVVYVTPSAAASVSSRWSHPSFINAGYFCVSRSDDSLSFMERIRKADIYIYTPYSVTGDGERVLFYTVFRNGEKVDLGFSGEDMYASFLSAFPTSLTAFVYEEGGEYSALYDSLSGDYPTLSALTYQGRISVVNIDNLVSAAESYYALIITDPLSSSLLYRRTGARIVMDERDAVGAVSLESVISVHYDWDRMIRSGFTPYYTFSVLHQ